MPKGKSVGIGATRVAANGYHYTKTEDGWQLTHRLTAEASLGRKLLSHERVRLVNGPTNYSCPEDVEVYTVKERSTASRRAHLQAKIEQLQAELDELELDESL